MRLFGFWSRGGSLRRWGALLASASCVGVAGFLEAIVAVGALIFRGVSVDAAAEFSDNWIECGNGSWGYAPERTERAVAGSHEWCDEQNEDETFVGHMFIVSKLELVWYL